MKGVGGPLLCIGDLLSDLEQKEFGGGGAVDDVASQPDLPTRTKDSNNTLLSSDLPKLFEEHYDRLNGALTGTDHSWTALTLQLCTALETANKLVQATNSDATLLSERVGELEKIVKRGDSAVAAAKAVHASLNQRHGVLNGSSQSVQ